MIARENWTPSAAARSVIDPAPELVPEKVPPRMSNEALVLAVLLIGLLVAAGWSLHPAWYFAAVAVGGFLTWRGMDPGEPE